MTAALIFKSGRQVTIDPAGVERCIAQSQTVTRKGSNGSQIMYRIETDHDAYTVVANAHSESEGMLEDASHRSARKEGIWRQ